MRLLWVKRLAPQVADRGISIRGLLPAPGNTSKCAMHARLGTNGAVFARARVNVLMPCKQIARAKRAGFPSAPLMRLLARVRGSRRDQGIEGADVIK